MPNSAPSTRFSRRRSGDRHAMRALLVMRPMPTSVFGGDTTLVVARASAARSTSRRASSRRSHRRAAATRARVQCDTAGSLRSTGRAAVRPASRSRSTVWFDRPNFSAAAAATTNSRLAPGSGQPRATGTCDAVASRTRSFLPGAHAVRARPEAPARVLRRPSCCRTAR